MLKAAWRDGEKNGDQYLFVNGCENEESGWLSDVPVTGSTPMECAGVAELCIAAMRTILESDARLHAMTWYNREQFRMVYRTFATR